jgi:hypothetical protein
LEKNIKIIDDWVEKISKKNDEIGEFAICPFAKIAYTNGKVLTTEFYKEYDKNELLNRVNTLFQKDIEVLVFVYMDTVVITDDELTQLIYYLQKENKNLIFLKDHPDNPGFIQKLNTGNEVKPLFLVQRKSELLDAREKLKKTKYYSYWSEEYKKEIWSYGNES